MNSMRELCELNKIQRESRYELYERVVWTQMSRYGLRT